MRLAAIDRIDPLPAFDSLPIEFSQRPSRLPSLGLVLLCTPGFGLLVIPFGLVAALAAESPEALSLITDRPATAVQLSLGFLVAGFLVGWPLRRLFGRLRSARDVRITDRLVIVRERRLWGDTEWSAPLQSFRGVASHMRASLSGTRHEVILVHPSSEKNVLVHFSDRPSPATAGGVAALLGLPEIPAGELYRSRAGSQTGSRAIPAPV